MPIASCTNFADDPAAVVGSTVVYQHEGRAHCFGKAVRVGAVVRVEEDVSHPLDGGLVERARRRIRTGMLRGGTASDRTNDKDCQRAKTLLQLPEHSLRRRRVFGEHDAPIASTNGGTRWGSPIFARLRLYQWVALLSVVSGALVTALGRSTGAPRPAPNGASFAAGVFFGVITWFALGVDFPESNRRFSRLV